MSNNNNQFLKSLWNGNIKVFSYNMNNIVWLFDHFYGNIKRLNFVNIHLRIISINAIPFASEYMYLCFDLLISYTTEYHFISMIWGRINCFLLCASLICICFQSNFRLLATAHNLFGNLATHLVLNIVVDSTIPYHTMPHTHSFDLIS